MNSARRTRDRRSFLIWLVLGAATSACAAVSPPRTSSFTGTPSWSALSRLPEGENLIIGLRPGATVPRGAGEELLGSFLESDADTLTVRRGIVYPGTDQAIGVTVLPRDDILYVRTRVAVPDPTGNGTMIGLLVGLAASATTIGVLCSRANDCPMGQTLAIFVPLGSAAGAFAGRSYDRQRTDRRGAAVRTCARDDSRRTFVLNSGAGGAIVKLCGTDSPRAR